MEDRSVAKTVAVVLFFWLLIWLTPKVAKGQPTEPTVTPPPACSVGSTCVPPEDLRVFVQLLKDQKCRQTTTPEVTMDSVVIVTDKQGRVYTSGTGPRPFTTLLRWCNYELTVKSTLNVYAAQAQDPTWGFRFRPKATLGYMPLYALKTKDWVNGWDVGLLLEPFYYRWLNLNGFVGWREVGAGVGLDLTRNVGLYAGYGITWTTWASQVTLAVSFALW